VRRQPVLPLLSALVHFSGLTNNPGRLCSGTDEVVELTYDDGIDEDVIIIDEQDFTDAKAVAAKDAGCRLEMVIELVSAEAAVALREKAATAAAAAREE